MAAGEECGVAGWDSVEGAAASLGEVQAAPSAEDQAEEEGPAADLVEAEAVVASGGAAEVAGQLAAGVAIAPK